MSLVIRQATEYRDAYHEHREIQNKLQAAREEVTKLEESNRRTELRLNQARRQLLEEAQR